ncbi:hypothetical protein J2X31_000390 [Flavobacterium arsenatis]|uniref:Lipocalin-like domain-containing protein n=1 Tax=Flavobacterium arsenatis TaxID=1484332 RepID=A0ABU1TLU1_9FLAO|nr:DUF6252 family protein [Flavobacterium arsenatis]MDR6966397.1 hypothetical protein [Flavobacterium arsenatis]
MKTLKKISILFLATVLSTAVISCSGDDDGNPTPPTALEGQITANVGGANFTSITQGTTAVKVATGGAFTITVQGTDLGGRQLQLILNGVDATTGTYQISQEAAISAIGSYTEVNTTTFTSQTWAAPNGTDDVSGSITITEISDTNIKGTFNFTARNQEDANNVKEVTGGSFNVNFMQF